MFIDLDDEVSLAVHKSKRMFILYHEWHIIHKLFFDFSLRLLELHITDFETLDEDFNLPIEIFIVLDLVFPRFIDHVGIGCV